MIKVANYKIPDPKHLEACSEYTTTIQSWGAGVYWYAEGY
jgi:hypothetical protein